MHSEIIIDALESWTIKQQCQSFVEKGISTAFITEKLDRACQPYVAMAYEGKVYRFSDPDKNRIIAQLAHFYKRVTS